MARSSNTDRRTRCSKPRRTLIRASWSPRFRGPGSKVDVDHDPAAHVALEDAIGELGQGAERQRLGHGIEPVHRQVVDQARPRLTPALDRAHYGIDAEQIDAAQ